MARVYVADNEKNIRDLIASFLCEQSLEVEVFETGGTSCFCAFWRKKRM